MRIRIEEIFKMGNEKELSSEAFSKKIMDIAKKRDTRDNSSCIVIVCWFKHRLSIVKKI